MHARRVLYDLVFCFKGWPYPDTVEVFIKDEENHTVGHSRMSLGASQLPTTASVMVTPLSSSDTESDSEEESKPIYMTNQHTILRSGVGIRRECACSW